MKMILDLVSAIKSRYTGEEASFLRGFRPFLILLVIGLALYGRTIFFGFTYLDDNTLILDNYPLISEVKNIGMLFSNDVFFSGDRNYYRPLLNLSFMADAAVAGVEPVIFHLTNVLLHILTASLIFLLFCKLGRSRNLAMLLSLVFLVHPALTQAVAWIPGRNDSLLAVFILIAWIFFLNFSERPRLRDYLGYLLFFWLALLTKETAVFLPLLVIFYFIFIQPFRINRHDRLLLVTGSGAVAFFWLLMRRFALGTESTGLWESINSVIINSQGVLLYIGKLLLPFELGVFPILADSHLAYGIISTLILAIALWFSRQKRGIYLIFGCLWFLIFLLPSFIRPVGIADFLEHRAYLSFVGFLIVLAEIDWVGRVDWRNRRAWTVAATILILMTAFSFRQAGYFSDRLTFWQAAAESSPRSPLAQRNLGVMYYFAGDSEAARRHYLVALDLEPREPMVHNNLGVIYLEEQKYEEAEREFRRELEINPSYDKALFNLGESYYHQGRAPEAYRYWQAALAANPNNFEAYSRLLIKENQIQ